VNQREAMASRGLLRTLQRSRGLKAYQRLALDVIRLRQSSPRAGANRQAQNRQPIYKSHERVLIIGRVSICTRRLSKPLVMYPIFEVESNRRAGVAAILLDWECMSRAS